ncbi:permease [Acidiferrobacter sp. SPIII_3]|jgi:uncharacterized membrane protein|uniref:general stress protein n=1 Tax=Acidiferrobacter sp. SPIII_3 TaxID=1281578 RepID=UPI000D7254DD|nr:general stress protein [Acidiferrobacter sp. SPIII_3]AWP22857.1 permease [Acidiferrobacter sp. SPIII_3]
MDSEDSCVAVYDSHEEAEAAVKALQQARFDIRKISIVGRDYESDEHVVGFYTTGERMKYWGKFGAFWGGLWGLLIGAAFLWVPGVGAIVAGGPIVAMIISALEGGALVGGMSALGAGLYSLGIPKNSILEYETALKANRFLVIVHGARDEVERARETLSHAGTSSLKTHAHAAP